MISELRLGEKVDEEGEGGDMSLGCCGGFHYCRGRDDASQSQSNVIAPNNVRIFSYKSLRSATENFHPSCQIGGGGFGVVYKTWKLREEERLLEIVDSELSDYPEDEVLRFIIVGLFCTQAASSQRPSMKQVVKMLTKEVHLNPKALTEPGVYRAHLPRRLGPGAFSEASSSRALKGKNSMNPNVSATHCSFDSVASEILPR
ncbi:hypothetical protein SAY87_031842 [Trapa incisa]|uniref:Uncharacterized protein n=1 Tax=Trapa incisa TaxID=236973 RepID=A0AAN7KWQ5_9MYRT|nr:hypothetical protein SAY87_031842 [Trapa incisa]